MHHRNSHRRESWRHNRLRLEQTLTESGMRSSATGMRRHNGPLFRVIETALAAGLAVTGLARRGRRNALDLRVRRVDFHFPHLPPAFDGYAILHLSDLHLGAPPELAGILRRFLNGIAVDLVAITGDFQTHGHPGAEVIGHELGIVLEGVRAQDGVVAVLGNHDGADLVDVLEAGGIQVLLNERRTLTRRGEHLHVVGTDDPFRFYSPAAAQALEECRDGFRIALVHTVDLVQQAEAAGYALYLAGHSHGGQVALPGGKPVLTALDRNRHLAVGAWRQGRLQGYTSSGTGSANLPRFNTRPEATILRLVRTETTARSP